MFNGEVYRMASPSVGMVEINVYEATEPMNTEKRNADIRTKQVHMPTPEPIVLKGHYTVELEKN